MPMPADEALIALARQRSNALRHQPLAAPPEIEASRPS